MTVVSLDDHRPHREGKVKCVHCKHIWNAVAPLDYNQFECPECGLMKGFWYGVHDVREDEEFFQCKCSCDYFVLARTGPLCMDCGNRIPWDDL